MASEVVSEVVVNRWICLSLLLRLLEVSVGGVEVAKK